MEAKRLQPCTDISVRTVLPHVMQQMEPQHPRMIGDLELDAGKNHRKISDQERILKTLHPGKRNLSKIPTPALPAHTHCGSSTSPHHLPIFALPLPGSPKHGQFTQESKEFRVERCYSHERQNTSNAGNRDFSWNRFLLPRHPVKHHRLLQNIVFLVLKRTR